MNPSEVEQRVARWLDVWVVGEGLCPFAARPLREGRIRIAVCTEAEWDGIYRQVLGEVERLLLNEVEEIETSLVAVPLGLEVFDDYLEMLSHIEAALQQIGLDGVLQLASFHPDYVFEGVDPDDVTHYTNRSPYPLFHLIRQEPLARALAGYPNPEQIPIRNQQHMRELGLERVARLLAE